MVFVLIINKMGSHPTISKQLIETQGFKNVPPVILVSGEVGFYYINAEKLVRDGGVFEEHKKDSQAMFEHAVEMTREHPEFNEVIDIITQKASELVDFSTPGRFVSGGQTRDWLFSCPVAYKLRVPHISIYKDGKVEAITPDRQKVEIAYYKTEGSEALHIADLLTEASSCYRVEGNREKGWIPSLRQKGFRISNLLAVVDRKQGGVTRLKEQGVGAYCFVEIDEEFLREHSENPERDIAYNRNPRSVVEAYLRENGALALAGNFDPNGGKLDRAKKFMERYRDVLEEGGKFEELDYAVQDKYGKSLGELVG